MIIASLDTNKMTEARVDVDAWRHPARLPRNTDDAPLEQVEEEGEKRDEGEEGEKEEEEEERRDSGEGPARRTKNKVGPPSGGSLAEARPLPFWGGAAFTFLLFCRSLLFGTVIYI